MEPQRVRTPLTDSPWFWLYLFGTAGVLAIAAQSTRYGDRQSQHDRQFQGRQHIYRHAADEDAAAPFSTAADKVADLRPLYALLLTVIGAGWVGLGWQRFRERQLLQAESSRMANPPANGVDVDVPADGKVE